jgi:cysteine desulfurase family protein (TIGR01976 family)
MTLYPIDQIRNQFPALDRTYNGRSAVYFDGPGGSQVVQGSIDAIVTYMSNGGANLHGQFPSSRETEEYIQQSRESVADLLGAGSEEVAFGQNSTSLAFAIARSLSRDWKEGDEIVLSELDHRCNVDPWLSAAMEKGVKVRWLTVNPETLTLDMTNLDAVINEKTVLVAVTLASNAIGTIPAVDKIVQRAKRMGALVAMDAVHAVPHFAVDREKLGADILLCSAYKFFGPHVGIAVIRKELFETLRPYKLEPAPDYIPDKLETGTQNFSAISAVKPAIEFIESLGSGETRRERILSGYQAIEKHENKLAHLIREGLGNIPGIRIYQAAAEVPKTPTIAFQAEGILPSDFCKVMAEEHGVFVADGHFYATTLAQRLNVMDSGGWIRAGMAPYNTVEEAERFVNAVKIIMMHPLRR